jgi:hypothetical protein
MAGSRLDADQPYDALQAFIAQLETDLRDLSVSEQRVGGSNLAFSTSSSGLAYDWSGTLPASPQDPASGVKVLRVTATAQTMDSLFGDLLPWPLFVAGATWGPEQFLAALKAGDPAFLVDVSEDAVDLDDRRTKRWLVVLSGDTATTVGFKPRVIASDEVQLTIEELN